MRPFTLEWDKTGERLHQGGIDRGVMYIPNSDSMSRAWNGLLSVEDNTPSEMKSYYHEGIRFLNHVVPGSFEGRLTCFTYPDIFEAWCLGQAAGESRTGTEGIAYHNQEVSRPFHLSYRSKIMSDTDEELGYKIHILWNLFAIPEARAYQTSTEDATGEPFSYTLSSTPQISEEVKEGYGVRPTAHVSIDSRVADPEFITWQAFEEMLYGKWNSGSSIWESPHCPNLESLRAIFNHVDL